MATTGSVAVAATTGKVLWRSPTRWTVLAATPAGDQFYAADPAGALAALNAATGKVLWSVPNAAGQLASDGRRAYVSRDGITAYDASNGHLTWRRTDVSASRPIRAGGLLYVTDAILSPANGSTIVAGTGYGNAMEHPVIVDGRVLSNANGTVRAYAP